MNTDQDEEWLEALGTEFSRVRWEEDYAQMRRETSITTPDPTAWRKSYEPLASQSLFHGCPSKYKGFSGPVGSGKSAALCREAIRLAQSNPGCNGLIGAPSYRMLADVTRLAMRQALEEARIRYTFKAGDNLIKIPQWKVSIFFRSLSDPTKLVGSNLAWFGVDELTYTAEAAWNRLEARLRAPRAKERCGFAVWTPRGFDWVYNRFKSPEKKLPGYECIFAKPRENHHVVATGLYDNLAHSYDERFYRQEVLGEYLNIFAGQVYYGFDRGRNVQRLSFDQRLPLCWTMDFNVSRMSSVIAQILPGPVGGQPKEVRVLDEIVLTNSNTLATCDEFLERLEALTKGTLYETAPVVLKVYGDAAGESRSSKADKTDYQLIRQWASRNAERVTLSMQVATANPSIRSRVAAMNSLLLTETGDSRIVIDPRCKLLAEDLEQVGWKKDASGNETGELDKSNAVLTHISDALGYLVWKEGGLKKKGGPVAHTNLRF